MSSSREFFEKVVLFMANECYDVALEGQKSPASDKHFKEALRKDPETMLMKGATKDSKTRPLQIISMGFKTLSQVFDSTVVAKERASVAIVALAERTRLLLPCMVKITLAINQADPNHGVLPNYWSLAFDKTLSRAQRASGEVLDYTILNNKDYQIKLFTGFASESEGKCDEAMTTAYSNALKKAIDDPTVQIIIMMPLGNDHVFKVSVKDSAVGAAKALLSLANLQ